MRISAPVQTGPGAHPASCTMGLVSFPGVKRPGRGADPHPNLQYRGMKLGNTSTRPKGLSSLYRENLYLTPNVAVVST
jgi:hypothetical protein